MSKASETVVWLIRHGASTFNLEGRCQGCSDEPELAEPGRQQARVSGERLRRAGIEAVICSPLRRAAHTAMEILDALRSRDRNIPCEADARLREIELPEWEGLTFPQIQLRFPEEFQVWQRDPFQLCMKSAAGMNLLPVQSLYLRAAEFWRCLFARYAGKSILLVTHGGTGRALITTALGMGAKHFHRIQQSNCGISRLRFIAVEDVGKLEVLNDTAHLGDQMPKLKSGKTGLRLLLVPVDDSHLGSFERVSRALEPVPVESVLAVGADGKAAAAAIFGDHRANFLQQVTRTTWAERLQASFDRTDDGELRQIVLVAAPHYVRRVLQERLGLERSTVDQMVLAESGLSAVHCPGRDAPAVLQTLNAFEPHSV